MSLSRVTYTKGDNSGSINTVNIDIDICEYKEICSGRKNKTSK